VQGIPLQRSPALGERTDETETVQGDCQGRQPGPFSARGDVFRMGQGGDGAMYVWLMASGYIHCLEVGVETIRHRDGMARQLS
jgi:hypothetical protein